MMCAIRQDNGYITIKKMSRIRYWFLSKENKELTQLFMWFVQEYVDMLHDDMDVLMIFNTYVMLLENGLFSEDAFEKALVSLADHLHDKEV